ncbi:hypothetical protein M5K25_003821 [Dendrobium thyrsiflorum]|uniref:C2 domain-containing protein n=1 Tax=Dendrobium thyrsiflorum TaxID=117978 RepID=A0ABD0VK92_DENTH
MEDKPAQIKVEELTSWLYRDLSRIFLGIGADVQEFERYFGVDKGWEQGDKEVRYNCGDKNRGRCVIVVIRSIVRALPLVDKKGSHSSCPRCAPAVQVAVQRNSLRLPADQPVWSPSWAVLTSQIAAPNIKELQRFVLYSKIYKFILPNVQVVSPEFTFYDSSKLALDNPLHLEKLLRARLDLRFMYASKENDTWARALVKDFTIESGSGLLILEPMDVSGGYTSVKDKTSISMLSSDICIHLSLSVASLLLKLQNQAFEAVQCGKVNPLVSCTNFKRIWISPKGVLPGYNLTFWRPQPPSNYAILGDCVTSRPVPPTQVVVAVSNAYGRVRKPLGFKLVGLFSNFEELIGGSQSDSNADCSIWMPIPPPGYTAVGCVAQVGSQPPSNHVVYCLRSDLVTSTTYSDCIFYVPPQPRALSGFSIWHVDNVLGSFYAHSSVDYPPKDESFDLHQILLRYPNWHFSVKKNSPSASHDQQTFNTSNASSGWDILRTLSRTSYFISTPHFERIWWDKGSDLRRSISIWRPIPRQGFAPLGDCITEGLEPPALGLVFKCDNSMISSNPIQFTKVAHAFGKGLEDAFFWYPIPPPGHASLGCVVTRKDEAPRKESFCCPRIYLVNQANVYEEPISRSSSSKGLNCWSIWKVENQAYTFLARSDLKKPSSRLAYTISECVKPKTRENISAEMKLGCFSFTLLDSFLGTMTPVIDTTITNINLATHGGLEAMNAVLICSMAASTFNRQLESWEPLVEPFDGIFKLETYDTCEHPPSKIGKRIRVAATSSLNLNVSAANLETISDTVVSWERQNKLVPTLSKKDEVAGEVSKNSHLSFSALHEDDLQKVVIENKLGCDIYLRKIEETSGDIELLRSNNRTSLLVPPPRFSDRLNVATKSRETRYYVTIQIFESKGFPIVDDGNKQDYFCALRLLIDSKVSDQYKLFPQSARTRCVRPLVSEVNGLAVGYAKWNEVFIFEVPEKGLANLEVEVTNLAAKAGKGEVIGALSVPLSISCNTLKRATSIRMLQQAVGYDGRNISSYALRKRVHNHEENNDCGMLVISTAYFERNIDMNFQKSIQSTNFVDRDVGFWVGLGPEGPWEIFSSVLPLSVVPKSLDGNPFAFEVLMRNGRKHAILRALAVIKNETDIKVEVSLCPSSMLSSPILNEGRENAAVELEEIFENQRYQPISGWGNLSNLHGDPGHWSTRDFSYSSKEFFEPPLPSSWRWISAWRIDKSNLVDSDGWAYGTDFQNLKWPPSSSMSSSKSALHFVRRRRWIRNRKLIPDQNINDLRNIIAIIDPASSSFLPWTSMASDSDLFLQVRPYVENPQELYVWGQIVSLGFSKNQSANQLASVTRQNMISQLSMLSSCLRLNNLEKNDILLCCNPCISGRQSTWFSVGTDASVLHTELNAPIYDWKISINSVLKLENKLPYEAEYAIWEKTIQGNMVERQHGTVSSNGSSFISSADIHRPIYLTLFVHGGWILEKEAVLIMNLLNLDHASSFWLIHQQTKRRVRVSVEYDMGGTDAAPKSVRLFVPYWICNDSSVPLSYRIEEVDPLDNLDAESLATARVVKSAKFTLKHSSKSIDRRPSNSRGNSGILEVIDDFNPNCVMLSTQDYIGQGGASSFSSSSDGLLSTRVGISVAVHNSERYSSGISFTDLERMEQVDVKAYSSDGSYFKLSAQLRMSSDRTKVISFLPHTLFINRVGRIVYLSQCDAELVQLLQPSDPPKIFKCQSSSGSELLKLSLDGCNWSSPFSIKNNGMMCICIKNDNGDRQVYLRVEVRNGLKSSRYEVVFRLSSFYSPYRIENRSLYLPLRFRQVGNSDGFWHYLPPNSAAPFFWEDLGRQHLLEILVDGTDPIKSQQYNIDEVKDHQTILTSIGPTRALRLMIVKEGKLQITRISDWMPENDVPIITLEKALLPVFEPSENDYKHSSSELDSEFHITCELAEFGLSIIDHMPEEILYVSIQNLIFSYSSGLGSGISRVKLRMNGFQVDNQLPFTPMPVIFGPQKVGDQPDYVLKFSMTMQTNSSLDFCEYPYLGFQVPDNSAFVVYIHEPIIWRLHELFQQVKFGRLFGSTDTAVSVDPIIKIGLLNISEVRFKVSMAMSPSQRPRGVLGFWSSLMTALGNTEHMQIRIGQKYREEICMRQSALISTAISNIQKDLLSHPFQLLSGVDILGNASSALSNMSKGVAALSMDKKFIQSRQKQDSKAVEDFGDVIREGGGALAKGLFRGVTGILTKPLEGAKSSGVEGFVQGFGKGIIGAAAQPVSGVLDLLSKTTEGANAVRMKIASAITSEEQLLRRRLPRVIGGDNLLRPYDAYKATGQGLRHRRGSQLFWRDFVLDSRSSGGSSTRYEVILQLAESGSFFGQVDLFRVRGKFAFSDAYEDHFLLPKGKILLVTHRRVLLLQQPVNILGQRKFNPARDPCSVMWDVLWEDLVTMELTHGKKDYMESPPSCLILYMQIKSPDSKENVRIIKCTRGSEQANEIFSSIQEALVAYGPNAFKDNKRRKMPRPYTPCNATALPEVFPKEVYDSWSVQDTQESAQLTSSFGTVVSQSQPK